MTQDNKALFIIFGGTGDLAKRKLYPSLFRLFRKGAINKHFAVIGTARREWTNEHFREVITDSIQELNPTPKELDSFTSHFYYQAHNVTNTQEYVTLEKLASELDNTYQLNGNRVFYLAMAPSFFGTIAQHIKSEHILSENGFNRLIIEKPFGTDYQTAKELNDSISAAFTEDQIFRIDHYLGKEMVQNISAIRFGNNIFESLWNHYYIDNVQITLAESLGVEERGGYYDKSGALKDMVQNHILQIVALLAMEPPTIFSDHAIRTEKISALESIRIYNEKEVKENVVRGQYSKGHLGSNQFPGYHEEKDVDPTSSTETFVAGKLMIDTFRWAGVPFYIRTGKRLTEKGTRINIVFKTTPINVFRSADQTEDIPENILTIYIQPTEGFSLTLNGKEIGSGFAMDPVKLNYRHSSETLENSPEAYEKLLLDCLKGDATNFTHWDEVAASWKIVDVIKHVWDKDTSNIPTYPARTMGPKEAFDLLENDGRSWVWEPDQWYREKELLK
ncbi:MULTISPECIES: glucose-6-phosphate dehydrogenase [Enterococcaceae]|uniref:glucose-6-phosphate dehydrogenase n=1 Tax=Enterococcaceae TaxID=81852 RepID=UPI000E4EF6A4|nr:MULTISPECIES: glucose-6-phosphate dehydrogenase [Enterococcaceae]MCI0130258.1 glucose-6-phosphate dehydrogenase [Vagococcus sp. CY53-2]RGI31116.1 glucose-6-phosphate dehydrogenase [Melissococcus sp. OM08-11BH]UNM89078.1 glucose-6-phosphate dehydrogenase [Vagococcus sp. CY52-2]